MSLPKSTRLVANLLTNPLIKGVYNVKYNTDKAVVLEDEKDYKKAYESFLPHVQKEEPLNMLKNRYVGFTVRDGTFFEPDSSVTTPGVEEILIRSKVTTIITVAMVGGYSEEFECTAVAFRGTADKSEFEASIEAKDLIGFFGGWGFDKLVPFREYGIDIDGKCKKSVLEAFMKKTSQAPSHFEQSMDFIKNSDQNRPMRGSGHSLGGPLVTIFGGLAARYGKFPSVDITVEGAFSFMDAEAIAAFEKLGVKCNNFQYTRDPVPQLNNLSSTIGFYIPVWKTVQAWMKANPERLTKHLGIIWVAEAPAGGNAHSFDNYAKGMSPDFTKWVRLEDFNPSTDKNANGPEVLLDVKAGIAKDKEEWANMRKAAPTVKDAKTGVPVTNGIKK